MNLFIRYSLPLITKINNFQESQTRYSDPSKQGRHFNFFLGQNFFLFFNATGLLTNWKKTAHICSNFTLFIVPFFLFSLFFLFFFLFFLFFFFSFFFFLFSLSLGRRPPSPSNDAHASKPLSRFLILHSQCLVSDTYGFITTRYIRQRTYTINCLVSLHTNIDEAICSAFNQAIKAWNDQACYPIQIMKDCDRSTLPNITLNIDFKGEGPLLYNTVT